MKIDEEAFLRKLAGIIDDPQIEQHAHEEIEKKTRERKLLEQFERALSFNEEKLQAAEEQLQELEAIEIIPEVTLVEDIPPQAVLPVAAFVTPAVEKLMDTPPQDYEKMVSKMKAGLQKEIDLIKKTVVDLHQFATGLSNMGGGGEVNLRWLDDVDRGSIDDNKFMRYNASTKRFEFYDFVTQGAYMGDFEIVNNHINLLRPSNTDIVIVPTGNGSLVVPTSIHTNNVVSNTANLVYLSVINPTITSPQTISTIRGSNGTPQTLPGAALLQTVNPANTNSRIIIDTYGNNVWGVIAGRTARGNIASPTATQTGDLIFRIAGNGFGNSGFNPTGAATIDFVATENFTDTNRGAKIIFYATPPGSNTTTVATSIESDGIHLGHVYNPNGNVTNFHITGGANDQVIVSDGAGNFIWRNRHDDGTWTPVMIANTGSNVVFNVTNASYVKFGPIVNLNFDINVSSMGTAAGTLRFDGLPFPGKNTSGYVGTVTVSRFTGLTDSSIVSITGAVIGGNNRSDMWVTHIQGQNVSIPSLIASDLQVASRLIGSILYDTDY
jgi:hypothetical protein